MSGDDEVVQWTNKKYYINDTTQITLGKLLIVVIITLFQFLGLLCDNQWILTGSMFFLIANAFFAFNKSTKIEENLAKDNKELILSNKEIIFALRKEIKGLKLIILNLKEE